MQFLFSLTNCTNNIIPPKNQSVISFKAHWRNLSKSTCLLAHYVGKEAGARGLMEFGSECNR